MKAATNLITTFLLAVAQFIIGVMILAGKADIRTIGYYYIVSSTFMVLVSLIAAVALAINADKE